VSQTVQIGTKCFVLLNGRTYPGIVIGFWNDSIKGDAVRVESEAADLVRKPWTALSFWASDATACADKSCTLIVPTDEEHRAQLQHEVDHPPIDERMAWLAKQAGELPMEIPSQRDTVPQFPVELEP